MQKISQDFNIYVELGSETIGGDSFETRCDGRTGKVIHCVALLYLALNNDYKQREQCIRYESHEFY